MLSEYKLYFVLQFQSLFYMGSPEAALTALCTSPVGTYLTAPQGSNIDVSAIRTQFCMTNWTVVIGEVMDDFSIDYIMSEVRIITSMPMIETNLNIIYTFIMVRNTYSYMFHQKSILLKYMQTLSNKFSTFFLTKLLWWATL